ncbi:MAG: ANTAR domain-containing protein [Lachnospiraceae bacterium]|nr:ANTAR domain-containing protein [Lachnospiraceae bacterium]
MPGNVQRRNNILVVSGSDQFDAKVHKALPEKGLVFVDKKKTATLARRSLLEKRYDLVVINAPLSDEMGYDLAMDIVEEYGSSVIIATPPEIYDAIWDYVADYGIMVILKPLDDDHISKGVRFLLATQERMRLYEERMQKLEDKMEELKLVSQAKILLMEQKHISEKEAHRLIGKEAMDHGVSRRMVARSIIDSFG